MLLMSDANSVVSLCHLGTLTDTKRAAADDEYARRALNHAVLLLHPVHGALLGSGCLRVAPNITRGGEARAERIDAVVKGERLVLVLPRAAEGHATRREARDLAVHE